MVKPCLYSYLGCFQKLYYFILSLGNSNSLPCLEDSQKLESFIILSSPLRNSNFILAFFQKGVWKMIVNNQKVLMLYTLRNSNLILGSFHYIFRKLNLLLDAQSSRLPISFIGVPCFHFTANLAIHVIFILCHLPPRLSGPFIALDILSQALVNFVHISCAMVNLAQAKFSFHTS